MSDTPETREDIVTANYEAAVAQYGAENYNKIMLVVMKDISVSLGMIVDNTTPST